MSTLNRSQLREARQIHNSFQFINNVAFIFVNGSMITLFAILAHASSTYIGAISSFNYLSFMLLPLGQWISRSIGIVKTYAWAWLFRYLSMLAVPFVPFCLMFERYDIALWLIALASMGFNFFRGVGLVGNNPVIIMVAPGKELNRYLAVVFMLNFAAWMLSTALIATVFYFSENMWVYALLVFIGVGTGVWSAFLLFRLPEPLAANQSKAPILKVILDGIKRQPLRRFILAHFFITFVMATLRPFILVYTKEVYDQPTSIALYYTVVGFLGSLIMSAFSRLTVNFVGTKALYIFFLISAMVSMVPAVLSLNLMGMGLIILLLVFHFLSNFGMQGVESNSQAYFFGVIREEETAAMSIFYFSIYGVGGVLGSLTGGALLDLLKKVTPDDINASYRIFFLIGLLAFGGLLFFLMRLKNTGKRSVINSLGSLFNVRDIRALSLATKLEQNKSMDRQIKLLQEIGRTDSDAPNDLILESLHSPRIDIRRYALYSIEGFSHLNDQEIIQALVQDMELHAHTTGYISARILGKMQIKAALPALRRMLDSDDIRLRAETVKALGYLKDRTSLPAIVHTLRPDQHVYVVVQALNALELLAHPHEVRMVLRPLLWQKVDKEIGREGVLSASLILKLPDWFYQIYLIFLKKQEDGYGMLQDILSRQSKNYKTQSIQDVVQVLQRQDFRSYRVKVLAIWDSIPHHDMQVSDALLSCLQNPLYFRHRSFRFLVSAYVVHMCTYDES